MKGHARFQLSSTAAAPTHDDDPFSITLPPRSFLPSEIIRLFAGLVENGGCLAARKGATRNWRRRDTLATVGGSPVGATTLNYTQRIFARVKTDRNALNIVVLAIACRLNFS